MKTGRLALVCSCLLLLVSGCQNGGSQPKVEVFPVTGKVLDAKGQPVNGGMLSLRCVSNPEQVCSAVVNPEGNFKLMTVVGDKRVEGGQAGEYKVMYAPDTISQTELPVDLKATCKLAPGQGDLVIKLDK